MEGQYGFILRKENQDLTTHIMFLVLICKRAVRLNSHIDMGVTVFGLWMGNLKDKLCDLFCSIISLQFRFLSGGC